MGKETSDGSLAQETKATAVGRRSFEDGRGSVVKESLALGQRALFQLLRGKSDAGASFDFRARLFLVGEATLAILMLPRRPS